MHQTVLCSEVIYTDITAYRKACGHLPTIALTFGIIGGLAAEQSLCWVAADHHHGGGSEGLHVRAVPRGAARERAAIRRCVLYPGPDHALLPLIVKEGTLVSMSRRM